MPREAARNEIARAVDNGIEYVTYECPFKDGEVEKSVTVTVPSNAAQFQTWVLSLPVVVKNDKGEDTENEMLVQAYDRWLGATVTAAKAAEREAAAAESTIVKRDGKEFDLLNMKDKGKGLDSQENVKFASALVNQAYMQAGMFGWDGVVSGKGTSAPQSAFVVARRKLIEAGKVTLVGDGKDHEKMLKPVAA